MQNPRERVAAMVLAGWWLVCASVDPAAGVTIVWDGSSDDNWHNGFNWVGNVPPPPGNGAFIGNAPNNDVELNADVSFLTDLTLQDGADLSTNGFELDVISGAATTTVGDGSELRVRPTPIPIIGAGVFNTDLMDLDGDFTIDNSSAVVETRLDVSSTGFVQGRGRLSVGPLLDVPNPPSSVGLRNDGQIIALDTTNTPSSFLIEARNNRTLDLDGFSGNGAVATGFGFLFSSTLTIDGPLTDPFSGFMQVYGNHTLVAGPFWEIDGTLNFDGEPDVFAVFKLGDSGDPNTPNHLDFLAGSLVQVEEGAAILEGNYNLDGTLRMQDNTSLLLTNGDFTVGSGQVDLSADNVTLTIAADSKAELGEVNDLDGTNGDNTILLRPLAELGLTGQAGDSFGGTFTAGGQNLLRLRDLRFNTGADVDFGTDNTTVLVNGTLRIDADVDLDGGDLFANPHTYILNEATERLEINGLLEDDADASAQGFDGTIQNAGTVAIDVPGTSSWRLDGVMELRRETLAPTNTADVTGDAIVLAGELRGRGTISTDVTVTGGTVRPGNEQSLGAEDAGTLNFVDSLTVQSGVVWMDVSGPSLSDSDQIIVDSLELDPLSVLRLDLIGEDLPDMYVPTRLINAGTLDGVFGAVQNVPVLLTNTALAVTYNATFNDVLVQRALAGDANLNGQVEQGDLDAVLNNWGKSNALDPQANVSWATGDLNGNGQVEQGDLDAVLNNWGNQFFGNLQDVNTLPEPGAVAFAGGVITMVFARRSGRGRI